MGGLIAALYAIATYLSAAMGLAYGGIQFRISEALTILPIFTPAAIPGLIVGCFIGNLGSPFGMVDILLGTFATAFAAVCSYHTLGNVHNLTGVILQLMGVHDDGKSLSRLHKRGAEIDRKPLLAKQGQTHVCRICRRGVYRRHHRVPG